MGSALFRENRRRDCEGNRSSEEEGAHRDDDTLAVVESFPRPLTAALVALGLGCGAAASNGPQTPDPNPSDPPPSASDAPGAAPENALLAEHNRLRERHCAPPLAWSPRLEKSAQAWANHLRDSGCNLEHSTGKLGENLAAGSVGSFDGGGVVRYWYDENAKYSFAKGGFSSETGHFTQVVWRGTRELGCAKAQCNGMDLWVCQYDPPGNFQGEFPENVKPTTCH